MLEFTLAHPILTVILAWLAVIGLGHVAGIVREALRQPFLFYRHIAEGHRIRRHRAEMRALYERFGTSPPAQARIAHEFEAVDEDMGVYRKVERAWSEGQSAASVNAGAFAMKRQVQKAVEMPG